MRLHFLVEGPSEKQFLQGLLPRLIPTHTFEVYVHQGKGKLPANPEIPPDPRHRGVLDQLPAKLRAWGKTMSSETDRVVVLVDADDEDCVALREKLEQLHRSLKAAPFCLFRIAVEEVEAWYLGDWDALRSAFPSSKAHLAVGYEQDGIAGTWEIFQKVIGDKMERKPYWAERMGMKISVEPSRNKSPSFRKFCEGVRRLAGDAAPVKARSRKK